MRRVCDILIIILVLSLAILVVNCVETFKLSSFKVSPEVCVPGETVMVSATLANTSNEMGDYTTELLVNGVTEQIQAFTLDPGSSQLLSFALMKNEPGRYVVELGKLTTTFTILGVSNLKISPSEVEVDQPVTITADLQNVTETQLTYHCCLMCQGKELEARDITVAGSSIEKVTFTCCPATSGTHPVELGGLAGSFNVIKPAEFKIIDLDVTPNPVKVGEQVTGTATIENVGEVTGTYEANLLVDGEVIWTTEVTLAGGTTETVSFSEYADYPGNYNIEIDGQEVTLRVVQPVRPSTGTYLFDKLPSGEKSRLRLKNQRELDIVVVMCSSQQPNTPLAAVYVRANDSHTVMKVPEDTYILYYTLGQDWDEEAKKFLEEVGYYRFSEEFHFSESSRKYTIWTITFGFVEEEPGAPVGALNEDEFPRLV